MTDKEKPNNVFTIVKQESKQEDPEVEINNFLVEQLEELLEQAKSGEIYECIMIPRMESCGMFHPRLMTREDFSPDYYYMLDKIKYLYEESFYFDEE